METIRQLNWKMKKLTEVVQAPVQEVVQEQLTSEPTESSIFQFDPAIEEQLEMASRQIEVMNKKSQ